MAAAAASRLALGRALSLGLGLVIPEKEDVTRSAIPRADAATAAAAAAAGSGAVCPAGGVLVLPGVAALEPFPDGGGGDATPDGGAQALVSADGRAGRDAGEAPLPAGCELLPEPLAGEALGCVPGEALGCGSVAAAAGFATGGVASTLSASLLSALFESAPSGP